jgi:hypothetical protein
MRPTTGALAVAAGSVAVFERLSTIGRTSLTGPRAAGLPPQKKSPLAWPGRACPIRRSLPSCSCPRGPVPPGKGLDQARHQFPPPASASAARQRQRRAGGITGHRMWPGRRACRRPDRKPRRRGADHRTGGAQEPVNPQRPDRHRGMGRPPPWPPPRSRPTSGPRRAAPSPARCRGVIRRQATRAASPHTLISSSSTARTLRDPLAVQPAEPKGEPCAWRARFRST